MRFASIPTAWTSCVRASIATTDRSDRPTPRPRTYTSVLAVPRSTAMSRPPKPVRYEKKPMRRSAHARRAAEPPRALSVSKGPAAEMARKRAFNGAPRTASQRVEQRAQARERQPDDVQVVAFDALHQRPAVALDGVAPGAPLPLTGRHVAVERHVVGVP